MYPFYGALHVPYVPVLWSHIGAHMFLYIYSLYDFYSPLSVSVKNDLDDAVFDCVGLAGFESRQGQCFFIGISS